VVSCFWTAILKLCPSSIIAILLNTASALQYITPTETVDTSGLTTFRWLVKLLREFPVVSWATGTVGRPAVGYVALLEFPDRIILTNACDERKERFNLLLSASLSSSLFSTPLTFFHNLSLCLCAISIRIQNTHTHLSCHFRLHTYRVSVSLDPAHQLRHFYLLP